jgi:hypothetical protein
MSHALDHVFVCCSAGAAEEARRLEDLGLVEGPPNTHPGQGTASRRFLFANAYLELFWVTDEEEARGALARPTRLWERWSGRARPDVSPFAVVSRPGRDEDVGPPYASWPYRPPYLPAPLAIDVAEDTPLHEPAFFHLAFARAERFLADPPRHPLGVRRLTAVEIALTAAGPLSPAARAVEAALGVTFRRATDNLMTLAFDDAPTGGTGTASDDLRPVLPLVLRRPG